MVSQSGLFKVAAVQAAPVSFDLPASIQKLKELTSTAAREGADLVVFPEGFLSAYPWRYAFDVTIGAREPRGRQWYAKYHKSAVAIPSPEFEELCAIARDNQILLSVGIVEKERDTLYCTAILLSREGDLLYAHRKLIPTVCVEHLKSSSRVPPDLLPGLGLEADAMSPGSRQQNDWSGVVELEMDCRSWRRILAGSEDSFVGRTTCRPPDWRSTSKGSKCILRPTQTTCPHGSPACSTSQRKADALSFPAISFAPCPTSPRTIPHSHQNTMTDSPMGRHGHPTRFLATEDLASLAP